MFVCRHARAGRGPPRAFLPRPGRLSNHTHSFAGWRSSFVTCGRTPPMHQSHQSPPSPHPRGLRRPNCGSHRDGTTRQSTPRRGSPGTEVAMSLPRPRRRRTPLGQVMSPAPRGGTPPWGRRRARTLRPVSGLGARRMGGASRQTTCLAGGTPPGRARSAGAWGPPRPPWGGAWKTAGSRGYQQTS